MYGVTSSRYPYRLWRTHNNTSMHTLVYYAHYGGEEDVLNHRRSQGEQKLVVAHDESHPLTYLLFRCDPKTRTIDHHAMPLPGMTFEEFKELPFTRQQSLRVLYSNHADTLRLATTHENNQESKQTHVDLRCAHPLYQIHAHQIMLQRQ